MVKPQEKEIDLEELDRRIAQRFAIMDMFAVSMVAGGINALIISGAAGVGKTYKFENTLRDAEESGEIETLNHIKGKCTKLALYETLYNNRGADQVTMIDDCDSIFQDEDCMNILKAALDTSEERMVSYNSTAKYLEEKDIPQRFLFEGRIVFITNLDFYAMSVRGNAMSAHCSALMSRSHYLSLAVYSNTEIMVRVQQVVRNTNMLENLNLTKQQGEDILQYMWDNIDNLMEVSIRSMIKISEYIKMGDWREIANVMCLK